MAIDSKIRQKKYRQSEKGKAKIKAYKNLPTTKNKAKEYKLLDRYGINLEQYNELFRRHLECCAICGSHESELKQKLHVDHCHKTGKVRGLLCVCCNSAIGKMKDDVSILKSAVKYLENNG